jgi:hypothetical protein
VLTIKESVGTLVMASKDTGLEVMLIKLSTCSCLGIRMQENSQYEE